VLLGKKRQKRWEEKMLKNLNLKGKKKEFRVRLFFILPFLVLN
jgi:hypothetical protein